MIDFHQHLADPKNLKKEISSFDSSGELCSLLLAHEDKMAGQGFVQVNVIFNQPQFLFDKNFKEAIEKYEKNGKGMIVFTVMVDHKNSQSVDALLKLKVGLKTIVGVKFHPILQEIKDNQFEQVLAVSKAASDSNMFIIVDGSYGASSIYQYDYLKLVDYLSKQIKTPLVIAHGGTLKTKEAMLIALEGLNSNIYFDSSFIISFWKGSSVEQDFAFCIKKLGVEKYFFGSDYPYLDLADEIKGQDCFLDVNEISDKQRDLFFSNNAKEFLSQFVG